MTNPEDPKVESQGAQAVLDQLVSEILAVQGLASSIRSIGLGLPATAFDTDEVLAPELVFPALGGDVLSHGAKSLTLIEALRTLLTSKAALAHSQAGAA